VVVWKVVGAIAFLLVLASFLRQLEVRLEELVPMPEAVRNFTSWLPVHQKVYVLAGLIGGSLQGLLAALTVMSPAERNATKYKAMLSLLDDYTADRLTAIRAAAAKDDRKVVNEFVAQVMNDLAVEGKEWIVLQAALSGLAPKLIARQRGAPP
jgi:hypothetical protein